MTRLVSPSPIHPLGAAQGAALVSGPQVILKAALEVEREVSLVAGPRQEPFAAVFAAAGEETSAAVIRQHALQLLPTPTARRGIELALHAANSGRSAVAMIPNAQLEECFGTIASAPPGSLQGSGAMCLLMEDHPAAAVACCPRQAAMRLNIPCIEPADLVELRDALDFALRLSRVASAPVALVVHSMILRGSQSMEMRPNRVTSPLDAAAVRRRRKPRWAETGAGRDVMRLARRMELNRARALPSPGERVPIGFITVGPSDPAVAYVAESLDLHGRLPVLQLGLLHPLDETAVGRLLSRCESAIVLEPRPNIGAVEAAVLRVAERMRQVAGPSELPASVWGGELPPGERGSAIHLAPDEALHPSTLARKVVHLLHMIRPTMHVEKRLAPEPPPLPQLAIAAPQRGTEIGVQAALSVLRRMAADVDQWLRGQTAQLKERGLPPLTLAIDGIEPVVSSSAPGRMVPVEFWTGRTFQEGGIAAVRQATRHDGAWVLVVCDFDVSDQQDLERLARGVVPDERAERAAIVTATLGDRAALRSAFEAAVLGSGLTVLIVRDSTPPQYEVAAIERSIAEVDRFGFEPRQRLVWPADEACRFSARQEDEDEDEAVLDIEAVRTELTVERSSMANSNWPRLKIQPLMEQVEVIRTKPPAWAWRNPLTGQNAPERLTLPTPIHRNQPVWRAHIAGLRGNAPGVATMVLQDAGLHMGYDVASIHNPAPIGPGRRAWSQILFTRSRPTGDRSSTAGRSFEPAFHASDTEAVNSNRRRRLVPTAPYGEVDLLLGFDAPETLRAIDPARPLRVADPNRTAAVVNHGMFSQEEDREDSPSLHEAFVRSVSAVIRAEHRVIDDFAAASRMWFYTDRVADLVMLGLAFQRGMIPASLEAMESAVARAEDRGYGRSSEAFSFGRHLAVCSRLLARPRQEGDDELTTLVRRLALGLRSGRWGGAGTAAQFEGLVSRSLTAMPGLGETAHGRRAQRDFVTAAYRAIEWGGIDYATRFADVVTSLYNVDRGDTGRSLTRNAVLPLAEAMLIHDPIYIATMAVNPEQRRRLRQRLNVKHARGDRIERRYLTRVEMIAFSRRFRADVRTSDWPARMASALRRIVPSRWRGTRRERDIRDFVLSFMQRGIYSAREDYERWSDAMQRLHLQAEENRLRGMALAELRMLADVGS